MNYFYYYLVGINVFAFSIYGMDKFKAQRGLWRIPEKALLLAAALGGSVGAYIAMKLFHHKTRKGKFYIGVPVIFMLQVTALIAFFLKYNH